MTKRNWALVGLAVCGMALIPLTFAVGCRDIYVNARVSAALDRHSADQHRIAKLADANQATYGELRQAAWADANFASLLQGGRDGK